MLERKLLLTNAVGQGLPARCLKSHHTSNDAMPQERRLQSARAAGTHGAGVGHDQAAAVVVPVHVVAPAHGIALRLDSIQQRNVVSDDPRKERALPYAAFVHVEAR